MIDFAAAGDASRTEADEVGLEAKLAFLRRVDAYPEHPSRVDAVETHRSWVFLTDRHAFKLKKPLEDSVADFRTLDARRRACEEEVRINQRLAPAVYLGVVALTAEPDTGLMLGGQGPIVEWLIHMRRLPGDQMLDVSIARGIVPTADLRRVARVLARFYRDSPPLTLAPADFRAHLRHEMDLNLNALTAPDAGLPTARARPICARQLRFLDINAELFDQRLADGRIVDGHGDLRPQHVCLLPEPVIFDSLEFNARLRIVDAADELSFLGLECERLGAPYVAPILFEAYTRLVGDEPPPRLLDFYRAYRATMWARLSVSRTRALPPPAWGKWLDRAGAYLALAERHTERLS